MVNKLQRLRKKARRHIEAMYDGLCTISEWQDQEQLTGETKKVLVDVAINQPCRLSFSTIKQTEIADGAAQQIQIIKLFIVPEIQIKAGSKIIVTQNNITTEYKRSSKPVVYTNHQEIVLELYSKRT